MLSENVMWRMSFGIAYADPSKARSLDEFITFDIEYETVWPAKTAHGEGSFR